MSTLITELRSRGYEVSFRDDVYDPYTLILTKDDKTIKVETHYYKNSKEAIEDIERINEQILRGDLDEKGVGCNEE